MYLKIQSDCITFRVSQAEAQQLLNTGEIKDSITLNPLNQIQYMVKTTNNNAELLFDFGSQLKFTLCVNKQVLESEVKDRPSKQGIKITSSTAISAFLEIDLKSK
ncbi:DUF7009 family protein [Aliikangiella maris]|uniref:Uncharacterized protein n=2 Tax=Aliikangiella maris TaxID=3162458 RepID=A0ABV2BPN1_9GAMM